MISEGAPIDSTILKIEARDADLNPKLRYYLTGHGSEHFILDVDIGIFFFYIYISQSIFYFVYLINLSYFLILI